MEVVPTLLPLLLTTSQAVAAIAAHHRVEEDIAVVPPAGLAAEIAADHLAAGRAVVRPAEEGPPQLQAAMLHQDTMGVDSSRAG